MKRIRAVLYARVSTNKDSQLDSLEHQVEEGTEAIRQLGFDLVDTYIDEGETATTKEKRKDYIRMVSDMEDDKYDVIVVKCIDRIHRNVLDWYLFLDKLIKNGKQLYFYLDRKYYSSDDKLIVGIKAILAEEYSRELSEKINNAHRKRQEKGNGVVINRNTYGIMKVVDSEGNKHIERNPEEAEMIRKAADVFLAGYGARTAANVLYNQGYRNRKGGKISEGVIRKWMRSKRIMGVAVMNRTHYDFNTKSIIENPPEEYIEHAGLLPAIITEDEWKQINDLMDSRAARVGRQNVEKIRGRNTGKYNFSGKIICGMCGSPYYKVTRPVKNGHVTEWMCSNYIHNGRKKPDIYKKNPRKKIIKVKEGCDNNKLRESELIDILEETAKDYFGLEKNQKDVIDQTLNLLRQALNEEGKINNLDTMKERKETLLKRRENLLSNLLDNTVSKEVYKATEKKISDEIVQIEEGIQEAESKDSSMKELEQRIVKIRERLENGGIEKANAYTLMSNVKKIIYYSEERLEIQFDSLKLMGILPQFSFEENYTLTVSLTERRLKFTQLSIQKSKEQIYELIRENCNITIDMLAEETGLSRKIVFLRIGLLKQEGRLEFIGRGRHGHWNVIDGAEKK